MAFALDSDGELTQHGIHYIDVLAFLRSNDREGLAAADALEITFDVTALLGVPAGQFRITVEVEDVLIGVGSKYAVGPFPGDTSPRVPVLAVNRGYLVSAKAVTATVPDVLAVAGHEPAREPGPLRDAAAAGAGGGADALNV